MKNKIILAVVASLLGATIIYFTTRTHDEHEGHDHDTHQSAELKEHDEHEGHDHDSHAEADAEESDDHDGHDHGGGKAIGKGKAIEKVDEKDGFKLSAEAMKTLKLKLKSVASSRFVIPHAALVTSKDTKAVYLYRSGFFKMFPVKIIKRSANSFTLELGEVAFGDQVVTDGVPLLRVSDIYSTDTSEYGHAH